MTDRWLPLELPDEIESDVVVPARAGDRALAAVLHDGAWSVFDDTCTHAECPFTEYGEVLADEGVLVCNCHGAEFDLRDGSVLLSPAEDPLELLDVREREGRLMVRDREQEVR